MDTQWLKREIKFRAWDKETKVMYGETSVNNLKEWRQEPNVLMQFTGLKDKNGVEIYEGDVVRCFKSENELYDAIIEWNHGGLVMRWLRQNNRSDEHGVAENILHNIHVDGEVIGNVFENPELLIK